MTSKKPKKFRHLSGNSIDLLFSLLRQAEEEHIEWIDGIPSKTSLRRKRFEKQLRGIRRVIRELNGYDCDLADLQLDAMGEE